MRTQAYLKNAFLYCLALFLIYPLSPQIFKKSISLKEPAFICPLYTREEWHIRSDVMGKGHFGSRRSGGMRRHKGLDIAGYIGEPIAAAKSGIAERGEVLRGMGKYVKITHPEGSVTIYGHLSSIAVGNNSWVWQGQKIGEVGKTGNANYPKAEPHLHFELRIDGIAVDPTPYLINE